MSLGLANATNARDLGGLRTAEGRRVRSGLLFRSGALNRLTEDDLLALGRLGLACVVDFRSEREIDMIGPDRLPYPAPEHLVALPLADADNHLFASVTAMIKGDPQESTEPLDPEVLGLEMCRSYGWLATSAAARAVWAATIRLMSGPATLPLLFHCTAGKDRTGWLSAVVLRVLGVPDDVIMADYLRTTELSRAAIEFVVDRLRGRVPNPDAARVMLEARAEYLRAGFDTVALHYPSFDAYLREGLGLDDATLDALRSTLLEP